MLDLAITDLEGTTVEVGDNIGDHKYVIAKVCSNIPESTIINRRVWNYRNADWDLLRDNLEAQTHD